MMARSTKGSNQRPDTLMQDRTSANSKNFSCNARPDHTLGQKQTSRPAWTLSFLPPKADIANLARFVRFVPATDIGTQRPRGRAAGAFGARSDVRQDGPPSS